MERSREEGWGKLGRVNGLWRAWSLISMLALPRDSPDQGEVPRSIFPKAPLSPLFRHWLPCLFPATCYCCQFCSQTPLLLFTHGSHFIPEVSDPSPACLASQMPCWPQPCLAPSSELRSVAPVSLCEPQCIGNMLCLGPAFSSKPTLRD